MVKTPRQLSRTGVRPKPYDGTDETVAGLRSVDRSGDERTDPADDENETESRNSRANGK